MTQPVLADHAAAWTPLVCPGPSITHAYWYRPFLFLLIMQPLESLDSAAVQVLAASGTAQLSNRKAVHSLTGTTQQQDAVAKFACHWLDGRL